MIKYQTVKGTNLQRAYIIQPDGKRKGIALFGKVKELAEKEIIFLDGKPVTDMWVVLLVGRDTSSYGLTSMTACKDYIEREYNENAE